MIEVHLDYKAFANSMDVYIVDVHTNGSRSICTSLDKMEFKRVPENIETDPTFTIPGIIGKQFFEAMADALHKNGFKPQAEVVMEGEMKATKNHLEDMRALVFETKKP